MGSLGGLRGVVLFLLGRCIVALLPGFWLGVGCARFCCLEA
jgi:hypothetical protein